MKLSKNQEKFCLEYHKSGNATQAYIDSYSTKSVKSAEQSASRLLSSNVKVQQRMQELQKKATEKYEIKLDEIIKENAKLAFQDLNKVLTIDSEGNVDLVTEGLDFNQLDGVTLSKSESDGEKGFSKSSSLSIKLSAKVKALQELARLTGGYDKKPEDNSRNREANADAILGSLTKFTK